MTEQADVIVVGAGLAGLVATYEMVKAGRKVLVVDQESSANLGGQAFWSLGGLFLVDSPEQRRLGIKDSYELAIQDWMGTAAFDRAREDQWPRLWAQAYVEFAAGEKRQYLHDLGLRLMPNVGWAERGRGSALGQGNSVPRFHITWGTGPGVVEVFLTRVIAASKRGLVTFKHRHQVDEIVVTDGAATGVRGTVLEPSTEARGVKSSRTAVGEFEFSAQAVVVTSGGIGGNPELVKKNWPARLGKAPENMLAGVPAHVEGRMLEITENAGGNIVNRDRMWHYTEGIQNWDPIWPGHGIRILPGPSSMWFDALGRRLPDPCLPGYDTLGTLKHLRTTEDIAEHDHSWFILTQKIIEKEFALSGSEQNPDITAKDRAGFLKERVLGKGAPGPVDAFLRKGADFVTAPNLEQLVEKMNGLTDKALLDAATIRRQIEARDLQIANSYSKDAQVQGIRNARRYLGWEPSVPLEEGLRRTVEWCRLNWEV